MAVKTFEEIRQKRKVRSFDEIGQRKVLDFNEIGLTKPQTFDFGLPPITDEVSVEQPQIGALPELSTIRRLIEGAKEKIREKTGLFEPPIYGPQ